MDSDPESSLKNIFVQLLSFGFSFLDDAILVGLSNLGVHWPALEWLSKIVLIGTVIYWTRGIWRGLPFLLKPIELCDRSRSLWH